MKRIIALIFIAFLLSMLVSDFSYAGYYKQGECKDKFAGYSSNIQPARAGMAKKGGETGSTLTECIKKMGEVCGVKSSMSGGTQKPKGIEAK